MSDISVCQAAREEGIELIPSSFSQVLMFGGTFVHWNGRERRGGLQFFNSDRARSTEQKLKGPG